MAYIPFSLLSAEEGEERQQPVQPQECEAQQLQLQPQPEVPATPPMSKTDQNPNASNKSRIAFQLALVLVVVVLAAVLYYRHASSAYETPANSTDPLYRVLVQNPINATNLTLVILNKLNSMQGLNISYSGNASISIHGNGSVSFAVPFNVTLFKYGNNLRILLNASNVPSRGNMDMVGILLSNGIDYLCLNLGKGRYSSLNGSPECLPSSSYNASISSSEAWLKKGLAASLTSLLEQENLSDRTSSVSAGYSIRTVFLGINSLNGRQCYLTEGSDATNVTAYGTAIHANDSTNILFHITHEECLSEEYYLPLMLSYNMTMNVTGHGTVAMLPNTDMHLQLSMREIGIGRSVNESYVTALPQ